jgi:hypothetical protein
MDSLGDVCILSFNYFDDFTSISIEAILPRVKANLFCRVSHDLLKIDLSGSNVGFTHKADNL